MEKPLFPWDTCFLLLDVPRLSLLESTWFWPIVHEWTVIDNYQPSIDHEQLPCNNCSHLSTNHYSTRQSTITFPGPKHRPLSNHQLTMIKHHITIFNHQSTINHPSTLNEPSINHYSYFKPSMNHPLTTHRASFDNMNNDIPNGCWLLTPSANHQSAIIKHRPAIDQPLAIHEHLLLTIHC